MIGMMDNFLNINLVIFNCADDIFKKNISDKTNKSLFILIKSTKIPFKLYFFVFFLQNRQIKFVLLIFYLYLCIKIKKIKI